MGIDLLEITFRIEKQFGMKIQGDARGAFQTAGTLSEHVWLRLQGIQSGSPDFGELSKQIDDALPPKSVRRWWFQSADFEGRFENGDIEENWRRFQKLLGMSLPPLIRCSETKKLRLPRGFRTYASVTLWLLQNHSERMKWHRQPSVTDLPVGAENISRQACWEAVRDILADVLLVDPGQVTPEAHLIEDLGMG
jgi:acyl carrier protein